MSERVVETVVAGGLLRVRARALPLPAASAAALEAAAPVAHALRRAADSAAAAAEPVVQEQLDELREGVAAGADDAKVPPPRFPHRIPCRCGPRCARGHCQAGSGRHLR